MTSGDERRAMPPSEPARTDDPPYGEEQPSLFRPVSIENRITGEGSRRRAQAVPTPGSSYDFGREEERSPTVPLYLKKASSLPPRAGKPAGDTIPVPFQSGALYTMPGVSATDAFSAARPSVAAPVPFQSGALYTTPGANETDAFSAAKPSVAVPVPFQSGAPYTVPCANDTDAFSAAKPSVSAPVPFQSGAPYTVPGANATDAFSAARPPVSMPKHPDYVPKHGGVGAAAPPMPQQQAVDPWITLGWKAPVVPRAAEGGLKWTGPRETETPADSGTFPPFAADRSAESGLPNDFLPPMVAMQSSRYPPATVYEGDASVSGRYSAPYDAVTETGYPPAASDTERISQFSSARRPAVVPPPVKPPKTPAGPSGSPAPRKPARQFLKQKWQLALLIVGSLAVLFCVVEIARMAQSLMTNQQDLQSDRQELSELAGVDPNATAEAVELLPAGQTYAPTNTPLPVRTPTPEPRIAQNDPLIGVLDSGGAAGDVQTVQPAVTSPARTRLTAYPNNPLLSESDEFANLRQQNADVVGRLTIEGVLDETLVQRNNTYYLTHNARGVMGYGGAVFVDEGILLKKPPENLLIRGQATDEGKLLQPLAQYGSAGKAFVQSHGIVTCHTLYEQADYVVFAVIRADSDTTSANYFNYAGYLSFQTDEQMLAYVQNAKNRSLYPIAVGVQASDRLLTLATLPENGDTTCWVLLCRMLRSGETAAHIQTE